MKIIYYDKNNIDHILFCCLYNNLYGETENLSFIDYHNLFDKSIFTDLNKKYTIIFLEYLPLKEYYTSLDEYYLSLNENSNIPLIDNFIFYTNKVLKISQTSEENTIQNILDNVNILYNDNIHNYFYYETNSLCKFLLNTQSREITNNNYLSNIKYFEIKNLIEIFDKTCIQVNYKSILIQKLFNQYLSNIDFKIIFENLFEIGLKENIINIYYNILGDNNLNYFLVKNKFDKLLKDINWNILIIDSDRKYINIIENNKELFFNENVNHFKLIKINTLDINESLLNHNSIITVLSNYYKTLIGLEFFKDTIIEYHNPITLQSLFIPIDIYIPYINKLKIQTINYFKDNNYLTNLINDYYNDKILSLNDETLIPIINELNEINPIYNLTIKKDEYSNSIFEIINTNFGTNLNIQE